MAYENVIVLSAAVRIDSKTGKATGFLVADNGKTYVSELDSSKGEVALIANHNPASHFFSAAGDVVAEVSGFQILELHELYLGSKSTRQADQATLAALLQQLSK
jgi:hypothetical protein